MWNQKAAQQIQLSALSKISISDIVVELTNNIHVFDIVDDVMI
jgi:hypothetical protein